jgi:UDP-N-acetylglucosamine--N-acetylmuramyl-(pentapeptide) pyrophosphoryl-undecaprenol N-acetylglucosamine transferase
MTALLVATTGGHLRQLYELRPRLPGAEDAVWFTLDTPQSRSLLAGEEVHFGVYTPPRSVMLTLRNAATVRRLVRSRQFDVAFSTGATLAVSALPVAASHRVPSHYIESATRVGGPSLTGRILRAVPGVRTYTQYPSWAGGAWHYGGSIFDGFESRPAEQRPPRRVLVTLGTTESYPFGALVRRVLSIAPADVEVIWQTVSTEGQAAGIESIGMLPSVEFDALLRDVDAVIAHAGTGSSIAALTAGRAPVLVPRRKARGEHVDDHQVEIAQELDRRGLARHREVDELRWSDVEQAASLRVDPATEPAPFEVRP